MPADEGKGVKGGDKSNTEKMNKRNLNDFKGQIDAEKEPVKCCKKQKEMSYS